MTAGTTTDPALRHRVLEAAVRCIGRWGLAKTTLDDISREAGCSRASVYRAFPGGKESLVEALAAAEASNFFAGLDRRIQGAETLPDLLIAGIGEALLLLHVHPALRFLAQYEPDRLGLVPGETGMSRRVLDPAVAFTASHLRRFIRPAEVQGAAEWIVRMVLSYAMWPAPGAAPLDHDHVVNLVDSFLLPPLRSWMRE
jgi:AcrR family transcriptional regulator